jgi:hypothetical protein
VATGVQIHDFNPGIAPSGLFWTIPVPNDAVQIDLRAQTASFAYDSLAIPDFTDFANGVTGGPSIPGVATFNVQWGGTTSTTSVRVPAQTFEGTYFQDTATIEFSVASPMQNNFTFTSDAASTSTSLFAEIGLERNGVFFR